MPSAKNSEKIEKLLKDLHLTQTALAAKLGVDPTLISQWVLSKKDPGPLPCLLLAAISDERDRSYWIQQSGISWGQQTMLAKTLKLPPIPDPPDDFETKVLHWLRTANTFLDERIKSLLEAAVITQDQKKKPTNP